MKKILAFIIFLIFYGSFYPFDFQFPNFANFDPAAFLALTGPYSKGDLLQNILLFMPYGFLGPFFVADKKNIAVKWLYAFRYLAFGFLFALLIQIFQIYFPGRVPGLFDALVNLAGAIIGYGIAVIAQSFVKRFKINLQRTDIMIIVVLVSWVSYKLFPFVPTLDFQEVKNSLKPLLLKPIFEFTSFWGNLMAAFVIGYLFSRLKMVLPRYASVLFIALVLAAQLFFVKASLSINEALGAAMGISLWALLMPKMTQKPLWLLCCIGLMIFVYFLYPFNFQANVRFFHWVPFAGSLQGSVYINLLSLFLKTFLYGSFLIVLFERQMRSVSIAFVGMVFVGSIEFLQMFIGDHTAEITDPLLVLILLIVFRSIPEVKNEGKL